jgi:pimeloyl-ACP methyl ester carboxylesterase/AcrR family transcriptional regulator
MARETVHCIGASDAAPEDIWAVAQDFAAPWHPMVRWMEQEPHDDGQIIRRFAAKGDDAILREKLTYLSHSDQTLAYTALEGIAGAHSYHARLKITGANGGSTLTWHADIEAAPARALEIAQGTKLVFDAGIAALAATGPQKPKPKAAQVSCTTSTRILGDTPKLALTVAPEGLGQVKTLCLFLHGIGGNRTNWDAQLSALGLIMPMAALDLRGYGESTLGFAQSQLDDYFDDIRAVMVEFKAERLVLCGLSYGAWIAASFALRHPELIAGLVLCGGCTGMSEADPDEREAFRISREVPLDAGQTPADFAGAVVNVIAGPNASAEARRALTASMVAIPAQTYRDALNCFTNPLERLDFSRASFPVLLMTGEHDRLAPPTEIRAVSQRFAQAGAPFVQFEEIADAGHVCNLEQSEMVNEYLGAFLERLAPAHSTPSAKDVRKAVKKERILDAALKEFSKNGFSGASMQAIAERAEVSKPTLYQYVGQKEDLFLAVLDQGSATILAPFQHAQTQNMVNVLWRFAWSYAEYVMRPDNLAIARLMIAEAERVPDVVRQFQEQGPSRARAGIARYLRSQSDAGHLRVEDSELAAEDLWSLILSGPRNHALHFPLDLPDRAALHRSIVNGLGVFLRAYAVKPDLEQAKLEHLASGQIQ